MSPQACGRVFFIRAASETSGGGGVAQRAADGSPGTAADAQQPDTRTAGRFGQRRFEAELPVVSADQDQQVPLVRVWPRLGLFLEAQVRGQYCETWMSLFSHYFASDLGTESVA